MQFQFDVTTNPNLTPNQKAAPTGEMITEILRQMLELQRQSLTQLVQIQGDLLAHTRAAAQDNLARWKNFLGRWNKEYPDFADHCKQIYPVMDRAYVHMLANMTEDLVHQADEALDNEFAVQEFLDKYGMRVSQLSHLLSIIGPLAEAATQTEAKS